MHCFTEKGQFEKAHTKVALVVLLFLNYPWFLSDPISTLTALCLALFVCCIFLSAFSGRERTRISPKKLLQSQSSLPGFRPFPSRSAFSSKDSRVAISSMPQDGIVWMRVT